MSTDYLLHWAEEFSELLVTNTNFCFVIFSETGKIIRQSIATEELFEHGVKSFINPTFDKIIQSNDGLVLNGYVTLGDYSSLNKSYYSKVYKKSGEILLILESNSDTLKEENRNMHLINIEVNAIHRELIREKANLQLSMLKIKESNIKLAKLNSDQNHFMSILAHDLKNPFNSILGFSKILLHKFRTYDDDKIESQLKTIFDVSSKAYYLLEDLLKWANSQSGNINFNPSKIEIEDTLNAVRDTMESHAMSKLITISCNIISTGSFFGDDNMFKTILRNLVSNAIKFTKENGHITLSSNENEQEYIFSVEDNGVGIKKDTISKIFDSQIMFTTYGTNKEKGTGLGLALCKEFVHYHKGEIWVESELGKGSTFIFSIPKSFSQVKKKKHSS